MSDVVMVSLVVILVARAGRREWISLGLVMAGVVAFAIADSSFAYLTEVNNYGSGNYLDTGWVAGYLLIGLGALWATTAPSRHVEQTEVSTISSLAPYLPVLVELAVTSIQLLRGRHVEPVAWVMAIVLVVLVLGREVLRLWDQAKASNRHDYTIQATHSAIQAHDADASLVSR
jgi:diguanylate cyclase